MNLNSSISTTHTSHHTLRKTIFTFNFHRNITINYKKWQVTHTPIIVLFTIQKSFFTVHVYRVSVFPSVDQRLVFEDSNTYYQFSFEECDAQGCEFRNEEEWQNGVRLLLQLVPYVQFRVVSP